MLRYEKITNHALLELIKNFSDLEKAFQLEINDKSLHDRIMLLKNISREDLNTFLICFIISIVMLYYPTTLSTKDLNVAIGSGDGIPAAGYLIAMISFTIAWPAMLIDKIDFYKQPLCSFENLLPLIINFKYKMKNIDSAFDFNLNDSIEDFLKKTKLNLGKLKAADKASAAIKEAESERILNLSRDLKKIGIFANPTNALSGGDKKLDHEAAATNGF